MEHNQELANSRMAELEKLQMELQEAVRESEKLKVKAFLWSACWGVTLELSQAWFTTYLSCGVTISACIFCLPNPFASFLSVNTVKTVFSLA